jgi:hypothetical protein
MSPSDDDELYDPGPFPETEEEIAAIEARAAEALSRTPEAQAIKRATAEAQALHQEEIEREIREAEEAAAERARLN